MKENQLPILLFTETGHMSYQYDWVGKATKRFDALGYEFHAYRNISVLPVKVRELGEAIKVLVIFTERVGDVNKILETVRELGLGAGKVNLVIVAEEGDVEAVQPLFKPWIRLMRYEQGPKVCEQIIGQFLGLPPPLSKHNKSSRRAQAGRSQAVCAIARP